MGGERYRRTEYGGRWTVDVGMRMKDSGTRMEDDDSCLLQLSAAGIVGLVKISDIAACISLGRAFHRIKPNIRSIYHCAGLSSLLSMVAAAVVKDLTMS